MQDRRGKLQRQSSSLQSVSLGHLAKESRFPFSIPRRTSHRSIKRAFLTYCATKRTLLFAPYRTKRNLRKKEITPSRGRPVHYCRYHPLAARCNPITVDHRRTTINENSCLSKPILCNTLNAVQVVVPSLIIDSPVRRHW